jgi:starch-binding outer membrane protein, SusD/RagB family
MNKLYKVLACLPVFLLVLVSSCTDHLDVQPTSVITNASFWKTEDDAKGALYGMYIRLRNEASYNLFVLGEARSETITFGIAGTAGFDPYYTNTLTSINPGLNWQGMYAIVNTANLLLKYVPNIPFTSAAAKNDILAQAHTMRAFTYYVMTRTWGDLPLRTEPIEGYNAETVQVGRAPQAEVFQLIKADIEQALQLYPTNNFPAGRNLWSKPATNALKADVHLWTGKRLNGGSADFTAALEACNAVGTADTGLLPSFASVFAYTNKGNREVLMAVRYDALDAPNNYFSNGSLHPSQVSTSLTPEDLAFVIPASANGNNIWSPSALVRNQFSTEDQRRAATFRELYVTNAAGVRTLHASLIVKGTGVVQNNERYYTNDVILYRYADVLLMKAEAKNALNQDPTPEMNLIRQRAYGTNFNNHVFVSGGKDQNDEAILKERLLELAYEGKRWWDLVRFGKAFEKVPTLQSRASETHLLLFPIANTTLGLEPQVSQNPGYGL